MWHTQLPLTSIRMPSAGTNKMFIMCECSRVAAVHLHRHLQLRQHQRLPPPLQLLRRRHLLLQLVRDPRRHRGLSPRREPAQRRHQDRNRSSLRWQLLEHSSIMTKQIPTIHYLLSVICLLCVATVSGQAGQRKPIAHEPLEKYNMPPAYIYRLETGPRMISRFGLFTSFQVNVDANGNNILGDAANESSITVDPTNHNRMAIGWRQFNSVMSDFRQGGWGFTTDAGTTWTFPGVLEDNVFRSDPVLKSDEAGNFFYLSLLESFCDNMYGSLDFGQTWTRLQPDGDAGGGDKQWFTIDKTNGPGHGFQYQSDDGINCSGGGVEFQRSTNGGVTWQAPVTIPHAPVYGTLDVDTNGNLFIGGEGFSTFFCERSSNAQIGGQTPTFDRSTAVNMGGFLGSGGINPAGLDGMLFLAID